MTQKQNYTIRFEPRGDVYRKLISEAQKFCSHGLLVMQDQLKFDVSASDVLSDILAFMESSTRSSAWPGTASFPDGRIIATVHRFRLTGESACILQDVCEGLYDWQAPSLPEDLCLLREDLSPWLTSIAHEEDSYLTLSGEERALLDSRFPELDLAREADLLLRFPERRASLQETLRQLGHWEYQLDTLLVQEPDATTGQHSGLTSCLAMLFDDGMDYRNPEEAIGAVLYDEGEVKAVSRVLDALDEVLGPQRSIPKVEDLLTEPKWEEVVQSAKAAYYLMTGLDKEIRKEIEGAG